MLISLLIILLLSNAVTLRRDKSILFSRLVIIGLISTSFLALNNLFIKPLENGIGIYGGLLNITTHIIMFSTFIFLISAIILTLYASYPRKVYVRQPSSVLTRLLIAKFSRLSTWVSIILSIIFGIAVRFGLNQLCNIDVWIELMNLSPIGIYYIAFMVIIK